MSAIFLQPFDMHSMCNQAFNTHCTHSQQTAMFKHTTTHTYVLYNMQALAYFKLIHCEHTVMLDKLEHLDWSHVVHIKAFITHY